MSDHTTKICTKCGKEYPATSEYFHKGKTGKYGLMAECILCNNERAREYRENNREKTRLASRKWAENNKQKVSDNRKRYYIDNKEHENEQAKEWRGLNREYDLERKRQWYYENSERSAETSRVWRINNREHLRELRRKWYLDNTEHEIEYNRMWVSKNKDRVKEYQHISYLRNREAYCLRARIYRHTKRANGGTFTIAQIRELLEWQNGCCLYCGVNIRQTYVIDHYLAVSRGGSNDITNLVLACHHCNASKGDKLAHEWYRMREFV